MSDCLDEGELHRSRHLVLCSAWLKQLIHSDERPIFPRGRETICYEETPAKLPP